MYSMNMSCEIAVSCFVSRVDMLAVPTDIPMWTSEIPDSTVGGQCPLRAENRFLPGMKSHIVFPVLSGQPITHVRMKNTK